MLGDAEQLAEPPPIPGDAVCFVQGRSQPQEDSHQRFWLDGEPLPLGDHDSALQHLDGVAEVSAHRLAPACASAALAPGAAVVVYRHELQAALADAAVGRARARGSPVGAAVYWWFRSRRHGEATEIIARN